MGIHRHFPEQVPYLPVIYDYSPQPVPEVVKGKETLAAHRGALVLRSDERASQLHGVRKVFFNEFSRKSEVG